jgi:DNA-binding PadR family transcriptional regulator
MKDADGFLPLKPHALEILLALAEGERHGYGMLKALEARGAGMAASVLYRRLRRLMEDGLVTEVVARRGEDDARRRYYALTELGRTVAAAEAARIVGLARSGSIRRLAAEAGGGDG